MTPPPTIRHQKAPEGGTVCGADGDWTWIPGEVDCPNCREKLKPKLKRAIAAARQVGMFDLPATDDKRTQLERGFGMKSRFAVHASETATESSCVVKTRQSTRTTTAPEQVTCTACRKDLKRYPQLANRMFNAGSP